MNRRNAAPRSFRPPFSRALNRRGDKKRAPSIDETVVSHDSARSLDVSSSRSKSNPGPLMSQSNIFKTTAVPAIEIPSTKEVKEFEIPKNVEAVSRLPDSDFRISETFSVYQQSPVTIITRDDGLEDPDYDEIKRRSRLQALRVQEMHYGEAHPDVVFSLQGLCNFHCKRGEFRQAQRVHDEACRRAPRGTIAGPPVEITLHFPFAEPSLSS